jgi:hypothetical protein
VAATWIKSVKIRAAKSSANCVAAIFDYALNPSKTDNGRLITSYRCDSRTADAEFLLAKKEYEYITGRDNGGKNVLAYHIRQSFAPGKVSPEEAGEIGRELCLSFTKGRYAFVVATHIDKAHVHNHIIFNSTSLDCTRKFKNFWGSSKAIRRISDLLCAEHGLSVIENPAPSRGSYGDWLGENKPPSHKEILKRAADDILPSAATYDDFTARLIAAGFEVNAKGKYHTAKLPDWGKPTRFETLGDEYTEAAIRARLGKARIIASGGDSGMRSAPSLLIDIQAKIREGKGAGYEHWAKIFNLKQAAKTLLFLREQGIDSYEDLKRKTAAASDEFDALSAKIRDADKKLKDIAELQKQISTYGKTRAVYAAYKKSGWDRAYYDANAADIILHRAAKKFFDARGFKTKLPSINQLKQEYATLAEKKILYGDYHRLRDSSRELTVAKVNADRILGIAETAPNRDNSRIAHTRDSRER